MNRAMTLPIEQEGARGISPTALIQRSGLLAVAAGASMVATPFVHPGSPQSAAWVPVHLLYFARQVRRTGILGVAALLTAFIGTAMTLLEGREHLFSSDFGQGTPVGLWQLIAASFVFSVGYILLGVTTVREGVLPRGAGVLLAVGGPIVAFAPPIGIQAVLIVGHALFGAGLAWSGYALFSGAEPEKP